MSDHPLRPRSPRLDGALVAAGTVVFAISARAMGYEDWPLGDGWNRYLGNAIAIAEGDPTGYLAWRGPGHAWACLVVLPWAGSLVRASQWVALAASSALVPLAWALGREVGGRWTGLLAALLLLAWPDLRLFAWFSAPYALEGALLAGGAVATGAATARGGVGRGLLAVVLLGAAIAVDTRGMLGVGAVALGALLARQPAAAGRGWAPVVVPLGVGAAAIAGGVGLLALAPVDLLPMGELVRLQHEMVRPLVPACGTEAAAGAAEVLGPCGRGLVAWNLARAASWAPVWPGLLAAFALVPLLLRDRRALVVALPVLTLLPALPLVAVQHRYLVPHAPFVVVLLARGALLLADRLDARFPAVLPRARIAAFGGALLLALTWHLGGPSLRTRDPAAPRGAGASASLEHRGPVVRATDLIRAEWRAGELVTDCAGANLRERLYPIPVAPVTGGRLRACGDLGRAPPAAPGWLFTRDPGPFGAGWSVVPLGGASGRALLHAEGPAK